MELLVCFIAHSNGQRGNFDMMTSIRGKLTPRAVDLIRLKINSEGYDNVVFTSIVKLDD